VSRLRIASRRRLPGYCLNVTGPVADLLEFSAAHRLFQTRGRIATVEIGKGDQPGAAHVARSSIEDCFPECRSVEFSSNRENKSLGENLLLSGATGAVILRSSAQQWKLGRIRVQVGGTLCQRKFVLSFTRKKLVRSRRALLGLVAAPVPREGTAADARQF
jgi:hypothetical protein